MGRNGRGIAGRIRQGPPGILRRFTFAMRSVASQVLIVQLVMVILLVAGAVVVFFVHDRRLSVDQARAQTLGIAESFAHSPGIVKAMTGPNPSAVLQPIAEATRKATGVDYIVFTNTKGIRYTHPDPTLIGKKVVGRYKEAAAGNTILGEYKGVRGLSVNAVVPIRKPGGTVVGLASAGVTAVSVENSVSAELPWLLGGAGIAALLAAGGAALVSKRLRRQTHGLGPREMTRMYEHHDAVLHSVREGVLITDGDGRVVLANDEARRLLDLPEDFEGRLVTALGLSDELGELLGEGRVASDAVVPCGDLLLVVNNRLTRLDGGSAGTVTTLRDTTELQALYGRVERVRGHLRLLYGAGVHIGSTLDVRRTADELARAVVPEFADLVTVDLADEVLRGEEPMEDARMCRAAIFGVREDHPFRPVGRTIDAVPGVPTHGRSGLTHYVPDLAAEQGWQESFPAEAAKVLHAGLRSLVSVLLPARGVVLGRVGFWRTTQREPFTEEDVDFAEELAARAALSLDNARRYTREHTMAVALQRSLLPRGVPEQTALDIASRYLPAHAGVGGDWFDVIPLPGARVALVVGDVVGHGLHAVATMGRLRTAVNNFSSLDLPPDELLGHLDELVGRFDREEAQGADGAEITGARCLYGIYDPTSGCCTFARAGHPGPAVVDPDGRVFCPELPPGPPLGLGGIPFRTMEVTVAAGSRLVLYTDGLIENREMSAGEGLRILQEVLAHSHRSPERTCQDVLDALLPAQASDDIALLVARTSVLDEEKIAVWEVDRDPKAVASIRKEVAGKLAEWGLVHQAFTTELILSELVTNAIRYGAAPIGVRLIHDRYLICEVSDASSTSPHLRYAAATDEGGRGLFLVAHMAECWGTRYTDSGKIIWAEQLPAAVELPLTDLDLQL